MSGKKRGSAVLWVLAALLLAANLVGLFIGVSKVRAAGRRTSWHLTVGEITATALDGEDAADLAPGRNYYELTFQLTNNSNRELQLPGYLMTVSPEQGSRYAARLTYTDLDLQYSLDPVAPIGTSTMARLTVAVRPDEMEGDKVVLWFDEYGEKRRLGAVSLP